jgi:hypothetical protein
LGREVESVEEEDDMLNKGIRERFTEKVKFEQRG